MYLIYKPDINDVSEEEFFKIIKEVKYLDKFKSIYEGYKNKA